MVIKFPKQQWNFCWFGPLTFGRIPSWPSSWSRFLRELDCRGRRSSWSRLIMEPDYRGQKPSWSRFLPELDYHGWGSSWSQLLTELDYHGPSSWSRFPEGSRLPQTNTLDMVQWLSSPSRKVLLPWNPVKLELALRAWLLLTVELEQALRAWLLPTVWEPFAPATRQPLTSLWPRVLRPVVRIHLLWELRLLRTPIQLEPVHWRAGLPRTDLRASRGTDHSGQDRTPFAHTVTANGGANTTDRGSSVNRMHSIAEASGTADMDQADMVRVVSMAMHTTGDTGHSQLSSLARRSHPYSSLLPRTVALEKVQTKP